MALVDAGKASLLDVTVVVPARNASRTLERCLTAARRVEGVTPRLVVLNDRSEDATKAIAQRCGAEVFDVPGEGGLGRGRNLGLDICRSRYLAFLNSDCYPAADWLLVLHRALESTGSAVAGGRQEELRRGTVAERWKAVHLRQDLGDEPIDSPDFLSGGNLLIDMERIAGIRFDERYAIAYEDVDFCRRLRAAGQRLVYRPAAAVGHDHQETLRSLPLKVWSYGAFSRSVPQGSGAIAALKAFLRMHSRPHDQIRNAIRDDLRNLAPRFLAVDFFLLAASLRLFLLRARRPMETLDVAPPTTV